MKSAGKMTSLLPWLFQDSSRRGAKKRRGQRDKLAREEAPLEIASLDGDTAMVNAAVGDRVRIEERPVAVAVREALFSMSRGGGPGLSRSNRQRERAKDEAAMNPSDDMQRDLQAERGEAEAYTLPAASLPSLGEGMGDAVAAERPTEPMTAQDSMVASLGAHRLGAHRLGAHRLGAHPERAMLQSANSEALELSSRPARRAEVARDPDAGRQNIEAMTSDRDDRPTPAQGAADDSATPGESPRRSTVSASAGGPGPASNDPNDGGGPDDETPPGAGSVANPRAANDETTLSLVDRLQQLEQRSALANQQAMMDRVYQEALKSELFDPKWYQATYRQTFESPRAAFDDYLRKSRFAPVNPSPRFDSETYHRMYMDVFHAQQSPLQHYLLHGRTEGRVHAPATVRWFPREVIEPAATLSEAASELKVALCLHVFYDDFIDRFANAIAAFPVTVDVFLTLADAKFETRAREVFEQHARVGRVETRVVPNRGRNFGPMLVEYGPALDEYDLLCHLHSKKSLYSGKEQTQWAEYLIEYLLRDVSVMTRLLNAFAGDDTLGMYYPTTFWMMPGWVNHLTMNKGAVRDWQNRLGLGRIPDFLSYPAGGMFWARPKALEGIFDQTWAYDDFPSEPLPNDDSMLHALERVIGPLVEHLGYRQLFFYPPTGQFTTDNGYITSSYHGHLDHHLPSIQAHPCVSFDVFDTLVRRRYTIPDYAKLKLGARLQTQGIVESAQAFVALRNQTESDMRRRANFQGDVRIADIYTDIGERLGVEDAQAQTWMNQEFELDLEMILPKDEMVELFNHLAASGHILWVISDSYYTRDQVGLMLRKAGVSAAYRLMVSSEEQARKDNGTLWIKVKQDLAREGISRHLHIGDNVVADAQRPGDMGMTTFHILHPMDKWRALGFPDVLEGGESLDEQEILKWGRLISEVGRNPFIGQ
ncbi:rhamnan synthesis F family protein [Salinicola halophilus]|uniref:rhamnan synthesis F family protein n=1 Tax=Salinicola halophilus TaxID=184065 RepID=UPI0019550767|nr:rhamnan synthesis F family protein [Salinicola halophilus]